MLQRSRPVRRRLQRDGYSSEYLPAFRPAFGSEVRSCGFPWEFILPLSLNGQQERLLECFRDPAQETRGIGAVNQSMIVGERERQDQPRLKFPVDPLRLHA